ncbi:MAG: levodione reductase, partial [Pseudomonadota bacterium]
MAANRKSIFVTGAASGLGREISRYFAERGWFIGLADVNEAGLKETAAMLPAGQWSIHKLDVTDRTQWKAALADFAPHCG